MVCGNADLSDSGIARRGPQPKEDPYHREGAEVNCVSSSRPYERRLPLEGREG